MRWRIRKIIPGNEREDGRGKGDEFVHRPSSFNYFFLAFFAGVVLLMPGFLQSAPVASTQTNPDVRLRSVGIPTLRRDWHVAASGATVIFFRAALLFGLFALIYNNGKQLVNAGVKGGKFLIHGFKAAVHLMLKMLNFSVEFFGALINDFVNDFQRNFFNCGMNEVFHIENVYHMNARSSNGLLFTHLTALVVLTKP